MKLTSQSQVCFIHDTNQWVISLFLSWPMNFSIIFSPPVLLRRGSERVPGWAGGSQPRSLHQARLSHQQSYNRKEDAVNIRFYIIKAFLCRWSLSRSSDFNLITVYWAPKISFPLILFSQLSISTAEQTRLSAFGIDLSHFCHNPTEFLLSYHNVHI